MSKQESKMKLSHEDLVGQIAESLKAIPGDSLADFYAQCFPGREVEFLGNGLGFDIWTEEESVRSVK